jgi:hypothetical protein
MESTKIILLTGQINRQKDKLTSPNFYHLLNSNN